jgi:hypothetical protein
VPESCPNISLRELESHARENLPWVAKQHGHSVQTIHDVYAAWIEGSQDMGAIRRAMGACPTQPGRILSLVPSSAPGVLSHPQHFLAVVRQ